jgi:hypothetical protein
LAGYSIDSRRFDCSILENFSARWMARADGIIDDGSCRELGFAVGLGFQALAGG